jgi:formamidopyrimidine-DNA glycosylase
LVFKDRGTLVLTEASQKKRAALHIIKGREAVKELAAVGLDVLTCTLEEFAGRLIEENRTLKRALTTPRLFDGIGNAYSDEILHAAKLSPMQITRNLEASEVQRLFEATRATLAMWIERLRDEFGLADGMGRFPGPGQITAFRPDFAVHGKFDQPCTVCGTKVQRIVYAENECNYCPRCQTQGRLLADRSLSRLLKDDWPRTIEELEGP